MKTLMISGVDLAPHIKELIGFMESSGVKLKPYPNIVFSSSKEHANDVFGKTGFYEPKNKEITVFTERRHPKDILKTIAHELIHHDQNVRGFMTKEVMEKATDPKYARKSKVLNLMEKDAYLRGNMLFRLWEDKFKA